MDSAIVIKIQTELYTTLQPKIAQYQWCFAARAQEHHKNSTKLQQARPTLLQNFIQVACVECCVSFAGATASVTTGKRDAFAFPVTIFAARPTLLLNLKRTAIDIP